MRTFEELDISGEIRRAIEELGFVHPTSAQKEVIPYLLGNKNDAIALAQIGTGKTAAYGLPLLQKIDVDDKHTQAIILSPTHGPCLQITNGLEDSAKYIKNLHVELVYGGVSIVTQIHALKHDAQIIVAIPERLIDLANRGVAELDHVNNAVLDKADEMLNMGFSGSINAILADVPDDHNTLLFSATVNNEIEKVAKAYLHDYKEIVVGSRNEGAENVSHIYYMANVHDKYLALRRIMDYYPRIFVIIFCRTKIETRGTTDKLTKGGHNTEALHDDSNQQQHDLTMQKFRQHVTQLLVATDVAAYGLDVDDLTHVINYGTPNDIKNCTRRSGRMGRAGRKDTSICIIYTREHSKMRVAEKIVGKELVNGALPTTQEVCAKQLYKVMYDIEKIDIDEEQITPLMAKTSRHFEYVDKNDIIKKIVSLTFGCLLSYYVNAPEIEKSSFKHGDRDEEKGMRGGRKAHSEQGGGHSRTPEKGYRELFTNSGKSDGFYPGEVMQFINQHVKGRQQVGYIDLLGKISYIEIPEKDANKVVCFLSGATYKGREVRCNDANEEGRGRKSQATRGGGKAAGRHAEDGCKNGKNTKHPFYQQEDTDDWRRFFQQPKVKFKGKTPDFSKEGWARHKPREKQ